MSLLSKISRGPIIRPHLIGLYGPGGVGKCLGRGTPVIMYNGTQKNVEDVVCGDLLYGPDGKPRKVIGTNRGVGPLYKVTCNKGENFICNDAHLLTVSRNGKELHEVSAADFAKIPDVKRKYYCGIRVALDLPEADLPLDPYFVGLWIGDGTMRHTGIRLTKPEAEIHKAVEDQAAAFGLKAKRYSDSNEKCGSSAIICCERGESTKPFPPLLKAAMIELGWNSDEKAIPEKYITASMSQRMELLAGIIDTDGHLSQNCYEITTKYKVLSKSIARIARMCGFQVTCRLKKSTIKDIGFAGYYYRLFISGDIGKIPTRNPKRKAEPRRQVKNVLRFGMKAAPIGVGEYFGFEVDGDHRFLLGDCTVTHNSTFAASAPKPIFLGTDDGTGTMDVARFPVMEKWSDALSAIDSLQNEKHEFETAVIDTVNGLEPLLWAYICAESNCTSIEEVDGGFGKGYVRATEHWQEFFKRLKRLRNKMNVICLGHARVRTTEDVIEGERFDRYQLKMHEQAAAAFHEAMDCMFFANMVTYFRKEKNAKKAKAKGDGRRVMFTEERPQFLAKSRFDLPFEMDLSWPDFAERAGACKATTNTDELLTIFKGMEADALDYLVAIGWLIEGQALTDLKENRRKPIVNRADDFRAAVQKYIAEKNNPTTEETNEEQ